MGGDLRSALGLTPGEMVAFVGAGGKTTAAWRLLGELADAGRRIVFTTTTRIFQPRDASILLDADPDREKIIRKLTESTHLVLAAARGESGDPSRAALSPYPAEPIKLVGLAPEVLDRLAGQTPGVTWLVEADGAKGRLLKAPADYEPVIPSAADRVIVVAGLDALGEPLDDRTVHRPAIAARLLDVPVGATITPDLFADLIGHKSGGLKDIPPRAELVVLLTRWTDELPDAHIDAIARRLSSIQRIGRVVSSDLRPRADVPRIW